MNRQSRHLSDRQIEEYVNETDSGTSAAANEEEVEAHISSCDSCRKRLLQAEQLQFEIPPHRLPGKRSATCPDEQVLERYAAGLVPSETASEVMMHVSKCDFCAQLLRENLQDFSDQPSDEAREMFNRLPVSQPEWRQQFIREHVVHRPTLRDRIIKFFSFFRGLGIAWRASMAGALALIPFAAIFVPKIVANIQLNKGEELTAAAFRENPQTTGLRYALSPPTFDMKLGGDEDTSPSSSQTWIKAEDLANEELVSGNPKWLRIKGRLDLLNKDIHAADFLQRAYDKGLRDPSTEIDLAAACFMRDTTTAQRNHVVVPNVNETVDWLQKALRDPKLSREEQLGAFYDLAIAYETMLHWDQAISIWERYLALDSTGPWAEEAARHLEADRPKVPAARLPGHNTPAVFEDHSDDAAVQNTIEEYQDAALRSWFFDRTGNLGSDAARAIRRLADVLEQQHQDSWLKDFLDHTEPADWTGVQALGAAITSNKRGAPAEAMQHARDAQAIFQRTGNIPGLLRSRFEEMYANQRRWDGQTCVQQAQQLDAALRGTAYRWLQVQLALTRAACLYRQMDSEAAEEQLRVGRRDAIRFGFHLLELRSLALEAGMEVTRDCNTNWQTAATGLELYWRGPSAPMRLYEFYSSIEQCLESNKLWHAAEAMESRMIAILENEVDRNDQDVSFLETARNTLKKILIAENESPATIAFIPCRRDPVCATYQLPIKLDLAELQLGDGDTEAARRTLEEARELAELTTGDLIRINFYRVYGDVLLKQQQFGDAGTAYKTGLEIAEQAFAGLQHNERRLQWIRATGEIYRGLVGTLLEQNKEEEALQLWEWYRSRPWDTEDNRHGDATAISWQQIENKILHVPFLAPASGTRLIYALIKDRIYIWTITNSRIKVQSSVKLTREQLEQRITNYAQEISSESSNTVSLEEDSQWLFSLLLAPVSLDLHEPDMLVVELDPWMNKLTLEALKSPEGWYFGLKYPIIYSPGMIKENELRPISTRLPAANWLLNALTGDSHSPIEGLKGIETVNALNITMAEFLDRVRDSEMFVFVGHGDSGGLRMPNRKSLQAEDFPAQSLQKLQLAVLVACSSGSAQDGLLDTSAVVHALLSGGVPQVIASQWDVSREKTNRLIGSVYGHLQSGELPARAMLAARREVFNTGNMHPYYWAAFNLTGRAD